VSVDESYEIIVPSYENTGKQELEVLGFSSLRRYKVWPKENSTTADTTTTIDEGRVSHF
jgi:hypothetical protein